MIARIVGALAIIAGVLSPANAQTGLFPANQFFGGPSSGSADWGTARPLVSSDLPIASSSQLGAIQGDGSTLTITGPGVGSCTTATTSQIGCSMPDGTTIAITAGVLSAIAGGSTTASYACTGSSDTSGINTAIATGKPVHLTGASCAVSSDLTFTKPGQLLYCDGRTVTTINASASAAGFTHGVLYFNTGEPGPTIYGCGIGFPSQVNTGTRTSLTNYPPAIYARSTPRFRILRSRITVAMVGVDMRGNSGGALIDDLEISCLSVCVWIDGSLDSVRISNMHNWPFGFTSAQLTLSQTPNANCTPETTSGVDGPIGLYSGRMDDLHLENPLFLVGMSLCFKQGVGNITGTPWLDGVTFGSITGAGFDSNQGIVMNQPPVTYSTTATNNTTSIGNNVLHFAASPAWSSSLSACFGVGTAPYDITHPTAIPFGATITTCTATTETLSVNIASPGVSSGDSIAGQGHNPGNVNASTSYFTGANNAAAAIVMNAGVLTCKPCNFANGSGGNGAQVQQSGGVLNIGDGYVDHGSGDLPFYNGSGGFVTIGGMQIHVTANISQTEPIIHIQSATQEAIIQGNHIADHGTGTGTFLQVDNDGFHNIIGNSAPGWSADMAGTTNTWAVACAVLSTAICANNN
jgi:hypothetical protein